MTVEFLPLEDTSAPDEALGVYAQASRVPRPPRRRDKADKGRSRRRASKIHSYIGPNGSGKSALMIFDSLPTLDGEKWECSVPDHRHSKLGIYSGVRTVLSTVALFDTETGLLHPLYVPLVDWSQLLVAEHCDVLLDEVMGTASSADHGALPGEVAELLQQLRHYDIVLRWTSPRFGAANLNLRTVTKAVTDCRGFLPDLSDKSRAWAPNRLFNFRTFSTADYDDDAPSRKEKEKKARPAVWMYGPGSRMFAAYDTLSAVSRLRKTSAAGACSVCGGRKSIPKCACPE